MRMQDEELEQLLGPMRDGPVALSGHAESAARRLRLLPGVRATVSATPGRLRRRRNLRRAGMAGAVCAVLLAGAGFVQLRGAPETTASVAAPSLRVEALGSEPLTFVDEHGKAHALRGDASVATRGELRAPKTSWSRVLTPRGARIELAPRARLQIGPKPSQGPEADVDLRLSRGEAHFSVPPLGGRRQFSIATPDARVVVHGTVFSVKVGPEPRARTCVRVNEGLVEVRHGGQSTFLRPGMQWGCQDAAAERVAPLPPVQAAVAPAPAPAERSTTRKRPARMRAERSPLPPGTLARETSLLSAALTAERDGDQARAHALFGELLSRHPRSPLVPEARAGAARTRP